MFKAPNMNKKHLAFFAEITITSAFSTIESGLDGLMDSKPNDKRLSEKAETLIDNAIVQLAYNLSILYFQVTGQGLGCSDAIGLKFLKGTNMDSVIRTFASQRIADPEKKTPDSSFLARSWVDYTFYGSPIPDADV